MAALQQTPNAFCPKIFKKLEKIQNDACICVCHWQSGLEFEVDHSYGPRRVVDMAECMCSNGKWKLSRIPCIHACSAIYFSRHKPEEYVANCYCLATYVLAYEEGLHVMLGPEAWPKDSPTMILPPFVRIQPGRPRKVKRKKLDEPTIAYKISRSGYVVNCGNCGVQGHNARSCPQPENPNKKVWKKKTKRIPDSGEAASTVSFGVN